MHMHQHGGDIYSAETPVTMDYSANLNPLGMPVEIRNAIADHVDDYLRYPDPHCRELRQSLSEWEQLPMEWILCGNGAADLILRIAQALRPNVTLLMAPTFSEYEKAAKLVDSEVRYYNLRWENSFRADEELLDMLTEDVDLFYLCNPNNPTGQLLEESLLKIIVDRCHSKHITLVVDECFLDFTEGISCKQWLSGNDNLIILKAFTKIFAMAGLRMGYCLSSNSNMLERIEAMGQSWAVSAPAQYAGIAGCQCRTFVDESIQFVKQERAYMEERLTQLGMDVVPGAANYIFFRGPADLWENLQKNGVLIRSCANYRGLDQQDYRICVKTREENERFLAVLEEVLSWENP